MADLHRDLVPAERPWDEGGIVPHQERGSHRPHPVPSDAFQELIIAPTDLLWGRPSAEPQDGQCPPPPFLDADAFVRGGWNIPWAIFSRDDE